MFEVVPLPLTLPSLLLEHRKYLSRDGHGTFEDYCRERWGMSKRHADRLIGSAEVVGNLTPIGVTPATESHPADRERRSRREFGTHGSHANHRIPGPPPRFSGTKGTKAIRAAPRKEKGARGCPRTPDLPFGHVSGRVYRCDRAVRTAPLAVELYGAGGDQRTGANRELPDNGRQHPSAAPTRHVGMVAGTSDL